MKKILCAVMAAVMACSLCIPAAALSFDDNELYLAAINTDLQTTVPLSNQVPATFSEQESARYSLFGDTAPQSEVFRVYEDAQTGRTMTELAPDCPELTPVEAPDYSVQNVLPVEEARGELFSYIAGESTRTIKGQYHRGGSSLHNYPMQCVFVGKHCTVWACTSDDENIRIDEANAQILAEQFDAQYEPMTEAFGDYFFDADGDGKVALLCYDIDEEYPNRPSTYYGGYFWMQDLIDEHGYIGDDFWFGENNYKNGMDCLHIDTFPAMGTDLNDISGCFSTLTHEFQHMLNFSRRVRTSTYLPAMDTFLDEAFSMAAQHLIFGPSSVAARVSYFNSASYDLGSPLTVWRGDLSSYAHSYLFGQYIRTRYARLGYEGSTIYKAVLDSRTAATTDSLKSIADILGTTKKQLVIDFWLAVALKHPTGPYGFNGEDWAEDVDCTLSDYDTERDIYYGSARFYEVSEIDQSLEADNLEFIYFDADGPIGDRYDRIEVGEKEMVAYITTDQDCTAYVAFYDKETGRMLDVLKTSLKSGRTIATVDTDELGLDSYEVRVILTDTDGDPFTDILSAVK